jgi:hypothetical protein
MLEDVKIMYQNICNNDIFYIFVLLNDFNMKVNIVKGVFTELIEGIDKKSSFTSFIDIDETIEVFQAENVKSNNLINIGLKSKKIKQKLIDSRQEYARIIRGKEFNNLINKLVELETEMIQSRCILNMDIKLGIAVRKIKSGEKVKYITARTQFYRVGYVRSDITVYMGSAEELGDNLAKLKNDNKFMNKVSVELQEMMLREMNV